MHLPPADFAALGPGWLVLAALLLVVVAATRLPVVGRALRIGVTLAIVALLVLVLAERERFDPYLGRIAGMLDLDHQDVSGKETRVGMSPDGHFWVRARINGVERRLLIDSGATVTALSAETARAAGLQPREGLIPIRLSTANGMISADGATVGELRLGNIVARRLAVVVSPAFDEMDVLGMNFLSRLASWRVEGRTLILVPHHPQASARGEQ
jgi:aspartyl protease family protein